MSSSDAACGPESVSESAHPAPMLSLRDRLLLWVAARLGPALDQLDVDPRREGAKVRDALVAFCVPGGPSPTEVRGAFLDLVDAGALLGYEEDSVCLPDAKVQLGVRGLLAARRLSPDVGRAARGITLRMKPWKRCGVFGAWLDTGSKERDKKLNASGVCLAAFYVLAAEEPSKAHPLELGRCSWKFARLAALLVAPKSGPGVRVMPSEESIREALDEVSRVVPLECERDTNDRRRVQWFLREPFPEVRITGAGGSQFEDWSRMRENLRRGIHGHPFPDRQSIEVRPLTDSQCMGLEKETLRKHRRSKSGKREATAFD